MMKAQIEQQQERQSTAADKMQAGLDTGGTATFEDNRSGAIAQRKLRAGMDSRPPDPETAQLKQVMQSPSGKQAAPLQRKANKTGLPDNLKSGIESLSGFAMDDVKVHYNSGKPAQLQAHAYAQGTNIHLAPGQEKHLAHEAWHVVQQKQGRVQPTRQLKSKVNINDDAGLEKEADVMGAKALKGGDGPVHQLKAASAMGETAQLRKKSDGAKVGLEIETTLPVRKQPADKFYLELMEEFKELHNAKNPDQKRLNQVKRTLSGALYVSPKEVIYSGGSGWRAEADHTDRLDRLYKKGVLYTNSCVEIVTEPVSTIEEAEKVMGEIHEWIERTMTSARKDGAAFQEEDRKYPGRFNDFMVEMPPEAEPFLLNRRGEVLGNFQVNLGAYLEEVPQIYEENMADVILSDFRTPQVRILDYLNNGELWQNIWERCQPLLNAKMMTPEDEPFLKSIMFQYMYDFISYSTRDRMMEDTLKNSYMILRKTSIARQIELSNMPSKKSWKEGRLANEFSRICNAVFDADATMQKEFIDTDTQGDYDGLFGRMAGKSGALKHVDDQVQEVDHPEQLLLDNDQYAGVFELRGLQGRILSQKRWLGVWKHYLDDAKHGSPYKTTEKVKKLATRRDAKISAKAGALENLFMRKPPAARVAANTGGANPVTANAPGANAAVVNAPVANAAVANAANFNLRGVGNRTATQRDVPDTWRRKVMRNRVLDDDMKRDIWNENQDNQ